ncbi:MAG: bifunctional UDP-N-acetylglucosamine diphosphorylase/glucosamine-1-phosphate N-acetyltransferase GlmU, partial [Geopsychrobacter sp.]|nr:bifunctional UDP-N-acetylglucosamine diphosphorylase/glucosamine-1-phosphate N-acetyltransferase GlmU [Geopsychrobacter sp.]
MKNFATVILAAGKGTRMKSARAKVLHEVAGQPLLFYPVQAAKAAGCKQFTVVVGHQGREVEAALAEQQVDCVWQREQLGTGHALLCAAETLSGFRGELWLLCGDVPLLSTASIERLLAVHRQENAAVTVRTAHMEKPQGYGRILRQGEDVCRIVEEKDANAAERAICEVNTGTYVFDAEFVFSVLPQLGKENAQGEYYLTDVVAAATAAGRKARAVCLEDASEALGINDRVQLAEASRLMRQRINQRLMLAGVTFVDPETTYVDNQVEIGQDSLLHPGVFLRGKSIIGSHCLIESGVQVDSSQIADHVHLKSGSVIEESLVGVNCKIGPMAHLRPGTELLGDNKIGNFVETKKARFEEKSQASHLTYIGDAEVGKNVNFGCGTITCNYDGVNKHKTIIEDDVF